MKSYSERYSPPISGEESVEDKERRVARLVLLAQIDLVDSAFEKMISAEDEYLRRRMELEQAFKKAPQELLNSLSILEKDELECNLPPGYELDQIN